MLNLNVPDNLLEADRIMRLYGAWSHDRYKKNHCVSYEWHYVPEELKDGYSPPAALHDYQFPDVHRAVIRVPEKHRKFLFAVYVPQRKPPTQQIRALGINGKDFDLFLQKGLQMFWNSYKVSKPTKG